jgi:putative glutamine amidotransferase
VSNVHSSWPGAIRHDRPDLLHAVNVQSGTRLAGILGVETFDVNTFHREAIVELSDRVVAAAHGPDGVVEAIEIPSSSFAIGLQWHPEKFDAVDHPGARVFHAFVQAARRRQQTGTLT